MVNRLNDTNKSLTSKFRRYTVSLDDFLNYLSSFIFMYYNRILRIWVVDAEDYFLLSAILASIIALCLKDYLSEKKPMERLKNSIIKKSESVIKSDRPTPNSKEIRIKKIYKVAVGTLKIFKQIISFLMKLLSWHKKLKD